MKTEISALHSRTVVFELFPLVLIIWADRAVDEHEEKQLRDALSRLPAQDTRSHAQVDAWLRARPSAEQIRGWAQLFKSVMRRLPSNYRASVASQLCTRLNGATNAPVEHLVAGLLTQFIRRQVAS